MPRGKRVPPQCQAAHMSPARGRTRGGQSSAPCKEEMWASDVRNSVDRVGGLDITRDPWAGIRHGHPDFQSSTGETPVHPHHRAFLRKPLPWPWSGTETVLSAPAQIHQGPPKCSLPNPYVWVQVTPD